MYLNISQFKHLACDSDMIQAAIDAAQESGEAVLVPKKNPRTGEAIYSVTKTIVVHSETTLILQNCHLRLADDAVCVMFANDNLVNHTTDQQENITIRGMGKVILDGGKHNGICENNGIAKKSASEIRRSPLDNRLMAFQGVKHLTVEGFTIKNQRYWALICYGVTFSRIANIHLTSESNVPNQDGIDLATGCHNVIIENITGCVGDNVVAICAMGTSSPYKPGPEGDVYNIIVRNLLVYGVGGCSIIRILNHDGYKIYNIRIDNLIEISPWSMDDAGVAPNPDLVTRFDEHGNVLPETFLVPGQVGYRCEAAIIIGESYWYKREKAQHGDTYGISVSNVMTHDRFAVWINNTLLDSTFENIRVFGNGHRAAYFGNGTMENVHFRNVTYDRDCLPLPCDEVIDIPWNSTHSEGFSCVYFQDPVLKNVTFRNMECAGGMDAVFGGSAAGEVFCSGIRHDRIPVLSCVKGLNLGTN